APRRVNDRAGGRVGGRDLEDQVVGGQRRVGERENGWRRQRRADVGRHGVLARDAVGGNNAGRGHAVAAGRRGGEGGLPSERGAGAADGDHRERDADAAHGVAAAVPDDRAQGI